MSRKNKNKYYNNIINNIIKQNTIQNNSIQNNVQILFSDSINKKLKLRKEGINNSSHQTRITSSKRKISSRSKFNSTTEIKSR